MRVRQVTRPPYSVRWQVMPPRGAAVSFPLLLAALTGRPNHSNTAHDLARMSRIGSPPRSAYLECHPVRVKALAAEFIGTAFLLAGVVGSGIMADRLSSDVGVVLLANAAATAGVLLIIIYMFAPVSGAHFNPVVTLTEAALGDRRWAEVLPYIVTQVAGGVFGTILANLMFDLDAVNISTKARDGAHLWLAEVVSTYGLVLVVFMLVRSGRAQLVAGAVAAYIGAAYWFTSSTSFANPAVTVARTLSDTFAGIDPASAPMFVVMQLVGAALAWATVRLMYPTASP